MSDFAPTALTESEQLVELLNQRQQVPQQVDEIDREICRRFSTTCAVVVLDMANFSRLTQAVGIIATLQQIQTMRDLAIPIIEQGNGRVLKTDADNLYAQFTHADAAVITMTCVRQHLHDADIHISVGIGYGELLLVDTHDLFGHEMNLASKLGEDLAKDDEIWLTEAAYQALSKSSYEFMAASETVSDVTFTSYRLLL
ncbi:MAG: adenylate/guanylate cyclase domain-containing protein [Leptolyngbyaceae cyanobacterium]